ncbi:MAG: creatininase family protein [Candidatus Desulfofervidaceae bacterium]|nr:creatininase family protein [Candidatus Desulfofervidaceae bacterium]
MYIEAISMLEFEQERGRVVIIPFGSIEEHGPHLPLATDTTTAYELAIAAGEKTKALVAPPVYYGVCRSTKEHPGTITISASVLRRLAKDIIKGFVRQRCQRFVLFSGHAGTIHMAALKEAGEDLVEENVVKRIAVVSILDLVDKDLKLETENDSHAGELETSLMLYLRPQWVKEFPKEDYPYFPKFLLVKEKRKYWPTGIWGNPQAASREKGERFFHYLLGKLIKVVEMVKE